MTKESHINTLADALIVIKDLEKLVKQLKREIEIFENNEVAQNHHFESLEVNYNTLEYHNNLQLDLMLDIGLSPTKISNMSVYQVMQIDKLLKQVEW